MVNKLYKPEDKLEFGVYTGETLKFVYTFDPLYIEFIIKTVKSFSINLDKFKDLHTCQIDKESLSGAYFNSLSIDNESISIHEYLKNYTDLLEKHYYITPEKINIHKFSQETLDILKTKNEEYSKYYDEDGLLYF